MIIGLVIALGITLTNPGSKSKSSEETIQSFVQNNLETGSKYTSISFTKIDEVFLSSDETVTTPLIKVKDSVGNQLALLSTVNIPEHVKPLLKKAKSAFHNLSLQTMSDYLSIDARLKRRLKSAGVIDKSTQAQIHHEETLMHQSVNDLNTVLRQYNLSIFGFNLTNERNEVYVHDFKIDHQDGVTDFKKVMFELSNDRQEVISFKEIS